jgi:ubiquinone/menaquinone biosynthesis C-methylase UbiE
LLPSGKSAVWEHPFHRAVGSSWMSWAEENSWEALIEKTIALDPVKSVDLLPDSIFRRAVYRASDYYITRYHQPRESDSDQSHQLKSKLITQVVEYAPRRILDIGSGSGCDISRLMKMRPSGTLTACLDLDFETIKMLEGYGRRDGVTEHLLPLAADVRQMPFPSDHFDAVISCNGLAHVEGVDAALEQIARILKKNGRFWLIEPVSGTTMHARNKMGKLLLHMVRNHLKLHHGSRDLAVRLHNKGFNIIQQSNISLEENEFVYMEITL